MGTLQVATNCFFTALNWTTGKLTVVDSRLVSMAGFTAAISARRSGVLSLLIKVASNFVRS